MNTKTPESVSSQLKRLDHAIALTLVRIIGDGMYATVAADFKIASKHKD